MLGLSLRLVPFNLTVLELVIFLSKAWLQWISNMFSLSGWANLLEKSTLLIRKVICRCYHSTGPIISPITICWPTFQIGFIKNKCMAENKLYEYNLDEEQPPPTPPLPPLPNPPSGSIGDGLDEVLKAHQMRNKAPLLPRSGQTHKTIG